VFSYYRMCSLTMECVVVLWIVFSYCGLSEIAAVMCFLTIECVLLP